MPSKLIKTWDIFCRVIDNFGDIGVCWRLARQLVDDHGQQVRLWVDDLDSLIRIWPTAQPLDRQYLDGVEVCHWPAEFGPDIEIADVVIEAFACDIPAVYLSAMADRKHNGQISTWINLDYLSAETWVEEFHRMPSAHPATGLRKTFFFPGFTPRTGGLLREQSLMEVRDAFDRAPWLNALGIKPTPDALLVSLFAYENPAINSLLAVWASASQPVYCLVPQGKIMTSIDHAIGRHLAVGDTHTLGNLCIQAIPFVTQTEYDFLLWACDINFVRGEDSFVRAQWAAKPMLWHIYPQDEDVHVTKLEAFLDRYTEQTPVPLKCALEHSWLIWNQGGDMTVAWQELMAHWNDWQKQSKQWCESLLQQRDLASQLVDFCATDTSQKSTTEKP